MVLPPVVPVGGGAPQPRGPDALGPVAALRAALDNLQAFIEERWPRIRSMGSCSQDFMRFLEELEELADRELVFRGFEKIPENVVRRRAGEEASRDLAVAFYRLDSVVIEVGLKGLNRCGIVEALTGGEPPRVYARVYVSGRAAFVLEAGERRRSTGAASTYYI